MIEEPKKINDEMLPLEVAAEEYLQNVKAIFLRTLEHPTAKEAFIAGAEWQREQMELDGIVTLTESDFNAEKGKASEWGYNLCKKQMMNGAVEVDVADLNGEIYNNCIEKGMTDEDKVKIVIIKDND